MKWRRTGHQARGPLPTVTPRHGRIQLDGVAKEAIEAGRTRLVVGALLFLLSFLAVGGRLVDLAVLSEGHEPGIAQARETQQFTTARAEIVDRNGVLLATNLATPSLYADPSLVLDPADAARRLAAAMPEMDEAWLRERLSTKSRFVWLKRNLTPRQKAEIHRLGIPGVYFQREEKRVYPYGALASHVLGFTDVDGHGLAGIERQFDEALRTAPEGELALSLDVRVQYLLEEELARSVKEFEAIGAAGVVLDVRSGEVVAMASLPDFDPNHAGIASQDERFNRVSLGTYEMGSTFKIFTTAMALDSGVVSMRDGYDASRPIQISRYQIRDFHAKNRWLSVPEIFMYSSNIGSAKMAVDVGVAGHQDFLRRMGFLTTSGIELPEVAAPQIPAPWREINSMTIAFGHGLAVTPIQLVSATAAVVNGGVLNEPTLLKRRSGQDGVRVMSPETSDEMRRLLRLVVAGGTGSKADVPGYVVGGKTGTAEKSGAGGYRRKALISSFVAVFPINAPRYVVLVMVDEPKGNKSTYGYATGGWTAAPAVARIIARAALILGVQPVDETRPEIQQALAVDLAPKGGVTLASHRAD